jgi:DUF4097 and DUF4098 domain-containing protein YvlB
MGAMSDERRIQEFQTPGPVRLTADIPFGHIKVRAEATGTSRLELIAVRGGDRMREVIESAEISQHDDEIVVRIERRRMGWLGWRGGSIEARIVVPVKSTAHLFTGSGHIEGQGTLGEVKATSGSGNITLDACGEVHARTGSGAITVASSTGSIDARTGSGNVAAGVVGANARIATGSGSAELACANGEARLHSASGSLRIDTAGNMLEAYTASGSIRIARADHGSVRAKTGSGSVSVGVVKGSAAHLDVHTMSGRVHSELEDGPAPASGEKQVELYITTMSGNVDVTRVAA